VAEQSGRKADLDKEGIQLQDATKAELDKDGISLEVDEARGQTAELEPKPDQAQVPVEKPDTGKQRLIMIAGGAAALVTLIVFIGFFLIHAHHAAPNKTVKVTLPKKESPFGSGGLVLDPFMVFYQTNAQKKSGVLLAQVSLKVDPSMMTNIESKLFDIRSIIYKRLVSTASVYSPTEIILMLSDDLIDYPIQEVAFVQYSAK